MKKKHLLIITGLLLFHAINNYFWLSQNSLPASYDEGIHLWTNLRFVKAFINPAHNMFYDLFYANTTHWPPLVHFTASIFNLIFGNSYIVSVMANMLFFSLLLISVYFIGEKIYNPETGILAGIIVSLYPIIYGHSRLFLLDFALTAAVTFSIYCLIATCRFKNTRWSFIFAISAGLGMLIKWTYALFILPLFLYEAIGSLRDASKKAALYQRRNLLAAVTISFLISGAWYFVKTERVLYALQHLPRVVRNYTFRPLEDLGWIILALNNNMISFTFFILLIACAAVFYTKIRSRSKPFIAIWSVIPLLAISFIKWKQPRFFMPVLPCFALITAVGIDSVKRQRLRKLIVGIIFTIGLLQYFSISFSQDMERIINHSPDGLKDFKIVYRPYMDGTYSTVGAGPPQRTDWRHAYLAKSFAGNIERLKYYPFKVGIIYDRDDIGLDNIFANRIMNYYIIKELIGTDAVLLGEVALSLTKKDERRKFLKDISSISGLVYISENNTWPGLDRIERTPRDKGPIDKMKIKKGAKGRQLSRLLNSRDRFDYIDRIELPHNYYANVYCYRIPEIKKDDLVIKVFNGRLKIFYMDRELTKDTGITFSSVHNGQEYGYEDAVWDFHEESPYQIEALCEWPKPDIKQSIMIKIDPDRKNAVNISVTLESPGDIKLESWRMDALMSGVYKLINSRYAEDGILEINAGKTGKLPAVIFTSSEPNVSIHAGFYDSPYYRNIHSMCVTADSEIGLKEGMPKKALDMNISLMPGLEQ